MSTAVEPQFTSAADQRAARRNQTLLLVLGAFLAVSLARSLSGHDDLTSSFTIAQAVISTLPILMAGLGGLLSERAGVVNIGLEGMMILEIGRAHV